MLLCIQQTIIVSLGAHFLLYEHQPTENVALEYIYCEVDTSTTYRSFGAGFYDTNNSIRDGQK